MSKVPDLEKIKELMAEGYNGVEIAKIFGCSSVSIYLRLKGHIKKKADIKPPPKKKLIRHPSERHVGIEDAHKSPNGGDMGYTYAGDYYPYKHRDTGTGTGWMPKYIGGWQRMPVRVSKRTMKVFLGITTGGDDD